jgi:hypothetical protein
MLLLLERSWPLLSAQHVEHSPSGSFTLTMYQICELYIDDVMFHGRNIESVIANARNFFGEIAGVQYSCTRKNSTAYSICSRTYRSSSRRITRTWCTGTSNWLGRSYDRNFISKLKTSTYTMFPERSFMKACNILYRIYVSTTCQIVDDLKVH